MPRASFPEAAADIVAIDEAMRLGYAWKWGPFELIDRIGGGMAEPSGSPPRASPFRRFSRTAGDRRRSTASTRGGSSISASMASTTTGSRPDGVLLLEDVKRADAAGTEVGLGDALGYRRRRRLSSNSPARAMRSTRWRMNLLEKTIAAREGAFQGARDLQRRHAFQRRRQYRPGACSRPISRPGPRSRRLIESGQRDLQDPEIRAVPRRRRRQPAWRSAAAARSSCTAMPSRRMPRPTPGSWNAASASCRAGAAARKC